MSEHSGQHGLDGRLCVLAGDDSPLRGALAEGLEAAGAVVAPVEGATTRPQAERAIGDVRERLGAVEMLVCCPPAMGAVSIDELSPDLFDGALAGGFRSPLWLTQAALRDMRAGGLGRVVYVTSTAGLRGRAYTSHVAAAARAVIALARTVALEEAPAITANAVAVGPLEGSALLEARVRSLGSSGAEGLEAAREQVRDQMPLGALPSHGDVLEAVLWALRPSSGFLTGQTIAVAGGSELQVWP